MSLYSRFAEHYEKIFPFRDPVGAFLRARLVPPGGRVLDVGCGPGHYCGHFAGAGAEAVGIDLDEEMIGAARKRYPAARFETLDMTRLDRLEGPFDLAFCIGNVASHVDEPTFRDVLTQIHRLLRPGGAWVVQVVNWDRFLELPSFAFPPRELPGNDLSFRREYRDISESGLEFRTELREGVTSLFHESTRLFPLREERYLALHRDAAFTPLGTFADFAETPFDPTSGAGMVLDFRRDPDRDAS